MTKNSLKQIIREEVKKVFNEINQTRPVPVGDKSKELKVFTSIENDQIFLYVSHGIRNPRREDVLDVAQTIDPRDELDLIPIGSAGSQYMKFRVDIKHVQKALLNILAS